MSTIELDLIDVSIALVPVALLAIVLYFLRLQLSRSLVIATIRLVVQLSLVGLVLKFVFTQSSPWLIGLMSLIMLSVASYEIMARQKYRLRGAGSIRVGSITLMISSFALTIFGLTLVIHPDPWYLPQYAIPLFGMVLSNTMTGISVGMDRLTTSLFQNRQIVEQRLMLGETQWESYQLDGNGRYCEPTRYDDGANSRWGSAHRGGQISDHDLGSYCRWHGLRNGSCDLPYRG
jgi:putative ABC transport system permease protein